ncbi:conserved hypothetical protein [Uncinocarpus reesii 1704]|uniref:Atos-like conserved domain-containing protein n=1 Tax=Uncinocarpus reesii (strain UAMH 1704) TaxID=336963 RepID=C4JLC9_UNCRE|nr:uncharacterized protein UREG_03637 [Uncinocarpus reesii 1704]EEP78791.1 conserved hypothetical protein [Uncinocarpus reesii 1704]
MPIFQDPDRQDSRFCPPRLQDHSHCGRQTPVDRQADGPRDVSMNDITSQGSNMDAQNRPTLHTSSREELIQSIKRGESPTWIPNRSLEQYFAIHGDAPQTRFEELQKRERQSASPPDEEILEPPQRRPSSEDRSGLFPDPPVEIERPRSALHSGDFREGSPDSPQKSQNGRYDGQSGYHILSTSPPAPWYSEESQSHFEPCSFGNQPSSPGSTPAMSFSGRLRGPSFGSFSANYVLKPPTSPLVYQARNPDLDLPHNFDPLDLSSCFKRTNRRQTLPPEAFHASPRTCSWDRSGGTPSSFNREGLSSYQGHRPRRSLTSGFTLQPASSPQNTFLPRARRPSHSSETGPLYHASMVGSFEESILRGRMSMSPSRPLDFTAQVGVLGRGQCKANLKCPPHVTVSFPAVFYSYPTSGSGRTISDDSPSPYVGYIDVENSFPSEVRPPRKSPQQITIPPKCPCPHNANEERVLKLPSTPQQERRIRDKRSRRQSQSSRWPPGGCYRIPQQGQLQIVIKNPNKTAVKLFLVPYDLEGMEPGTKTFVRQRSYSVGPIADSSLSPGVNNGSMDSHDNMSEKSILRYLVHFNICCPSKDRYYLYSGIRVVFANRVPDGKEKLRNEVHYPEPRYSPYKPTRDPATSGSKPENALKRRSGGFGFGFRGPLDLGEFVPAEAKQFGFPTQQPFATRHQALPIFPARNDTGDMGEMGMELDPEYISQDEAVPEPIQPLANMIFPQSQQLALQPLTNIPGSASEEEIYNKLNKGDAGYGGYTPPTTGSSGSESLLAQRLRNLKETKPSLEGRKGD